MYGRCRPFAVPYFGQRRNGSRPDADYRDSAPADEFGRVEYLVDISDAWFGKQRQVA